MLAITAPRHAFPSLARFRGAFCSTAPWRVLLELRSVSEVLTCAVRRGGSSATKAGRFQNPAHTHLRMKAISRTASSIRDTSGWGRARKSRIRLSDRIGLARQGTMEKTVTSLDEELLVEQSRTIALGSRPPRGRGARGADKGERDAEPAGAMLDIG